MIDESSLDHVTSNLQLQLSGGRSLSLVKTRRMQGPYASNTPRTSLRSLWSQPNQSSSEIVTYL
jgi:hypothetical protein